MSAPLFEPVKLSALGKGRIFWFPTLANPQAPKVAEATLNLTCVPDAGWEPTYEQSATSNVKYCSTAEYEIPGKGKWTGGTFVSEWDPQDPTDTAIYKHVVALAEGTRGYLGHSLGLGKDVGLAAGQIINSLYPVEWGAQVEVPIDPSNDGQLLQLQQRFFITGNVIKNVAVA